MKICECGAQIKFIKTKQEKSMPIDPEPINFDDAEENTMLISEDGEVYNSNNLHISKEDRENKSWFIVHFATCAVREKFSGSNSRGKK